MPSRILQIAPPSPPPPHHHHNHKDHRLVSTVAGSSAAGFSLLILLSLCFRRVSQKRTVPSSDTESKQLRRFKYSSLRRATSSFSPTVRLGQGGFGSVFRGTVKPELQVAVKVMDSGSLQGEREFQNELFFAGKMDSKYIVSIVGFCSSRRRRRMLLVYELLANGSLQDCLLHRKCSELMDWKNRFSIALDIAKGLEYLHHFCDPPIIHGDVKPSNILLDSDFKAKISDFGLARLKTQEVVLVQHVVEVKEEVNLGNGGKAEDNGSVLEETESVVTAGGFEGFDGGIDQSPESVCLRVEASPETVGNGLDLSPEGGAHVVVSPRAVAAMASPSEMFDRTSVSDGNFDKASVVSVSETSMLGDKRSGKKEKKSVSGKDWWWKQDNSESDSGVKKDYVKEWIGSEIKKERPKGDWIGTASTSGTAVKTEKKNRRRFDWWATLDDDKDVKKVNRRPAREWWREEYSEELAKKKKKKKKKLEQGSISDNGCENWWPTDDELHSGLKKKTHSKRSSKSSMDKWLDGLSGDLWKARRNSHDSASGEIPMSGGVSSTPSMRGTVCYAAPEYGSGGDLSEKCDVYSYGVLLLVLIAGRRPLQVTGSPMSEFQKANLLSWARHLARSGKLLELVDQSIHSLDKDQALLCITVALLCLQKSPARRPSMQQIVQILSGEMDSPKLPVEYSPSPPSRNPYKSRKKVR